MVALARALRQITRGEALLNERAVCCTWGLLHPSLLLRASPSSPILPKLSSPPNSSCQPHPESLSRGSRLAHTTPTRPRTCRLPYHPPRSPHVPRAVRAAPHLRMFNDMMCLPPLASRQVTGNTKGQSAAPSQNEASIRPCGGAPPESSKATRFKKLIRVSVPANNAHRSSN